MFYSIAKVDARFGEARRGGVRLGWARLGWARSGMARLGRDVLLIWNYGPVGQASARCGRASCGLARRGRATQGCFYRLQEFSHGVALYGRVRRGLAGRAMAGCGAARHGRDCFVDSSSGQAGRCWAMCGPAWSGRAGSGEARHGRDVLFNFTVDAWPGAARLCAVRQVRARRCLVWRGLAVQGSARQGFLFRFSRVAAGHGLAALGRARLGRAGRGRARHGREIPFSIFEKLRRGMAGCGDVGSGKQRSGWARHGRDSFIDLRRAMAWRCGARRDTAGLGTAGNVFDDLGWATALATRRI